MAVGSSLVRVLVRFSEALLAYRRVMCGGRWRDRGKGTATLVCMGAWEHVS